MDTKDKLQAIFDDVVGHLAKQGCKGVFVATGNDEARMRYKSQGISCAIGGIIPDDVYSPAVEGIGIRAILRPVVRGGHADGWPCTVECKTRCAAAERTGAYLCERYVLDVKNADEMTRATELMSDLQWDHDNITWDKIPGAFRTTAQRYGLDTSSLEAFQ